MVSDRTARNEQRLRTFIGNLDHEDAPYRWGAAEALGRLGDSRAVEPLIRALDDPDWRVRLKAAWSLGRLRDSRALPHLTRLAHDERDEVRDMAMEASQAIRIEILRAFPKEQKDG